MAVNQVNLANGEELINLTADTVSENTLLEGETAHDASGNQITGKFVPYNPNLLDNPDFSINQRGQAEYLSTGYTVDRWKLGLSGNGNTGGYNSSTKTLICNTVETNGYFAYLRQFFENPSKLAGKEVTFSAALKETDSKWLAQVWTYSGGTTTSIAATAYGNELFKTLTFTVPEDITDDDTLQFIIQTRGTSVLDWVKLELGSVATAFVPPNPATELAKCQRYYEKIEVPVSMFVPTMQHHETLGLTYFYMSYSEKRTSTYSVFVGAVRAVLSGYNPMPNQKATPYAKTTKSCSFMVELSSPTTSAVFGWVDDFAVEIDAEIY